jgi:ligand-binding sensor domain-containing protein
MVPGRRTRGVLIPNWNAAAISILEDGNWWYNSDFSPFTRARGFNSIAINPKNKNEIYIGSWLSGLYKINKATNEIVCYSHGNSPLSSVRTDSTVFVSGLVIDKQNNLWMAHSEANSHPIKVKELNTNEEVWHTINLNDAARAYRIPEIPAKSYVEHILIDSRNYKWFTLPGDKRLIVFSDGGSLDNSAQHKLGEVDLTSQVKVAANRITCIVEDREGNIWTGADQGVKVIYDAASVFNRNIAAKNILLEQNGYVQVLFEYEYVTCIAVDAANRKWIGTRNAGVFLISPTGTEELFHFTTDNSPLFSNQINDIKINPENGEVFFATEGGLISYKGTATAGKENYKEALVYPNPVRSDYHGPVAVKGLMEDSFCKITDAAGNLVWQGYAYGGQLIWNGKDFYGKRPATGVYFVMASNKTGKEKKVAKFLFVQ